MSTSFIKKIAALLPTLEGRGAVFFFALAEQEDIARWDVVLCADWSDEDEIAAVRFVADELRSRLLPDELTMISRIAVILSSDPHVREMLGSFDGVLPKDEKVIDGTLLGSAIRRAYIFKATRPPAGVPDERLAGSNSPR